MFLLRIASFAQDADSLMELARTLTDQDTQKVNYLNQAGISFWKSGLDSAAVACHQRAIRIARLIPFRKGEVEARLQLVLMEMDYLSDLEEAYAQLDSALSAAKEAGDRRLQAQTYFRRAQLYSLGIWEHSDKVKPLYDSALTIFRQLGDRTREGMVYSQLAGLESDEGRFASAIDYLLKARRLQESSGDIKNLRATLPNLGVMYMSIGLFEQALACFEEAERNAISLKDERVLAFLSGQRGEVYLKQGNPGAALKELKKAEEKYLKLGGVQFLTGTYARMGDAFLKSGQTDEALRYALKADSLFKALTDGEELHSHSAQMVLGDILLHKGHYKEVIDRALKGLEWARSANPPLLKEASEYHRQLALAYERTGSPGKAIAHQKQFKILSDSLLNGEMIQRVMASSLGYDFEKTQQADRIRIQALENRNLEQARNITVLLLIAGLAALGIVFWSNRRLKSKNEELQRKNEEIALALRKGQHIERKRVASELHDSLNTKIAGIRWQLESLDESDFNDYNRKIISHLMDTAGEAYDDIRLISHNMVPSDLEEKGLGAALQKLVGRFESVNGLNFTLDLRLAQRLPLETEQQLYHIALELINNVVKHARATEALISLKQKDDVLELTVADNGKGFDGTPARDLQKGMGLLNVRGRAAAIGAGCSIENGETCGAVVRISLSGISAQ
ncbi:MAG: hypothetical protein ABS46_03005 [Cytophagaceae bacterium SCN 52-12]|nr:MAG: hypothetical protein ABS46_03005 [Cytophagaceae bacterium SCN 52-12]